MKLLIATSDFNSSQHGISTITQLYLKYISKDHEIDIYSSRKSFSDLYKVFNYAKDTKVEFCDYDYILLIAWHHPAALDVFNRADLSRVLYFSHCVSFSNLDYPLVFRLFRKNDFTKKFFASNLKEVKYFVHLENFSDHRRFEDVTFRKIDFVLRNPSRFELNYNEEPITNTNLDELQFNILVINNLNFWKNHLGTIFLFLVLKITSQNRFHLKFLHSSPKSKIENIINLCVRFSKIVLNSVQIKDADSNEIAMAYRNCDMVFSYSLTECQPLVLVDGIFFGKPFLANNAGCISCMKGGMVFSNFLDAYKILNKLTKHQLNEHSIISRKYYIEKHSLKKFEQVFSSIFSTLFSQ
jgi:hypothetical protein